MHEYRGDGRGESTRGTVVELVHFTFALAWALCNVLSVCVMYGALGREHYISLTSRPHFFDSTLAKGCVSGFLVAVLLLLLLLLSGLLRC